MPKIVDHDARRREIVRATWRLVARKGIRATTMREIAREAGFANGALSPYFANKDAIVMAAFTHVFETADGRIEVSTRDRRGLDALRRAIFEVLPLDEERRLEARIVVPFWEEALTDGAKRDLHATTGSAWRGRFATHLREAVVDGDLDATLDVDAAADVLFVFAMGTQTQVVLEPERYSAERLEALVDAFVDRLRTER